MCIKIVIKVEQTFVFSVHSTYNVATYFFCNYYIGNEVIFTDQNATANVEDKSINNSIKKKKIQDGIPKKRRFDDKFSSI